MKHKNYKHLDFLIDVAKKTKLYLVCLDLFSIYVL